MKYILLATTIFGTNLTQASMTEIVVRPTQEEKQLYLTYKDSINSDTVNCINTIWNTHIDFFKKNGISKYYGDRNPPTIDRGSTLKNY